MQLPTADLRRAARRRSSPPVAPPRSLHRVPWPQQPEHTDGPNFEQLRRVYSRPPGPVPRGVAGGCFCVGQHPPQVLRRAKRCTLDDQTLHWSLSLCLCSLPAFATRVPGSAAERADEVAIAADLRPLLRRRRCRLRPRTRRLRSACMTAAAGVLAGSFDSRRPPLRRTPPPRRGAVAHAVTSAIAATVCHHRLVLLAPSPEPLSRRPCAATPRGEMGAASAADVALRL